MSSPRLIAFYLPQYYPTPENDEWWQPGFTEWTNVGKAKALFKGHDQPKVPKDLGYYDLRVPEVRQQQADLAKEAGIEGFCYWHYWFDGKRLLDRVFSEVLENKSPDLPFCLCWANHSWYAKTWRDDIPDKLLIEQTYPGVEDYIAHFNELLPAFKDERYMKMNGKLIFVLFKPMDVKDSKLLMETWNSLAIKNGLEGFYFLGMSCFEKDIPITFKMGYDGVIYDGLYESYEDAFTKSKRIKAKIKGLLLKKPEPISYDFYTSNFLNIIDNYKTNNNVYPAILPNFDHSPRSGYWGRILKDSTPEKWGKFCSKIFKIFNKRNEDNNLVFLKAWNEWGEGNYLEPDLKYGKRYLEELNKSITEK